MAIHRRVTPWTHGAVPESLLSLTREHAAKATAFVALPHLGRGGFKHCGLEVEIVEQGSHTHEEVAGAIMAMVVEHAETGVGQGRYRIDAIDENGDRLGDVVLRVGDDGEADDVETGNASGRWALRALDDVHKRHLATLDKIAGMVEMVGNCLDAMAGAVAAAAEAKMSYANADAEREENQQRHEKQIMFLQFLMKQTGRGGVAVESLASFLDSAPEAVRDGIARSIGAELYAELRAAAAEPDADQRKMKLVAVFGRITPAMKLALGQNVPTEWQEKLMAVLQAELGGLGGA